MELKEKTDVGIVMTSVKQYLLRKLIMSTAL